MFFSVTEFIVTICIALLVGLILGSIFIGDRVKFKTHDNISQLVSRVQACEKEIPRNRICTLVAIQSDKVVDNGK